jgi:Zn-dependent protease
MSGKGIELFRLFGFSVRIDWSWLIIALLVTWSLAAGVFPDHYPDLGQSVYWWMGVCGALGLFASILLHELGHSLVARQYGVEMRGITLFIFGGVAEMADEPPSAKAELAIAVAGPIVSVLAGAACYGLATVGNARGWGTSVTGVLSYLALINGILVAFNLVPAFPLDGGRVLRAIRPDSTGCIQCARRLLCCRHVVVPPGAFSAWRGYELVPAVARPPSPRR